VGVVCITLVVLIIVRVSPSGITNPFHVLASPSDSASATLASPTDLLPPSLQYAMPAVATGTILGIATFPALQPGWSHSVIQPHVDDIDKFRSDLLSSNILNNSPASPPMIGQPGYLWLMAGRDPNDDPQGPEPFTLLDQTILPMLQHPSASPPVFSFRPPTGITYNYQIRERILYAAATDDHPVLAQSNGQPQIGADGKSKAASAGDSLLDVMQANPEAGLIFLVTTFNSEANKGTEEFNENLAVAYIGQLVSATSPNGTIFHVQTADEYTPQSYSISPPR